MTTPDTTSWQEIPAETQNQLRRFVPPTLIDRLPEVEALTDTLLHLNSLYKALTSFLPLYIAEEELPRSEQYHALRLGTFMFADVSGFTALSEQLVRVNPTDGAEVLTIIMNDYFADMLEILAKSDGQMLKFAGDALLVFFPAMDDSSADLHKAIRAGWRMQRAIKRFQPISAPRLVELLGGAQDYSLHMSIGIARGRLFESLVGNEAQRDHLVQGALPGGAMDAEAAGIDGEVIIDRALAETIATDYTLHPLNDAYVQVVDDQGDELDDYEFDLVRRRRPKTAALFDYGVVSLIESVTSELARVQKVARYVAPPILNELVLSGNYHLRSENRLITTLFIYVTGFAELCFEWGEDDHLERAAALTERYYNMVQRVVTARGGTLTRSDPYKLGAKLLITFGAPIAHYDDPNRAVDAALEINYQLNFFNRRLHDELPPDLRRAEYITHRMGITMGMIFAGEVGWKSRREYTVMGDEVNLAARLMAKAEPMQILIDQPVFARVRDSFDVEAIEPLNLKGKSSPVHSFSVKGAAEPTVDVNFSSDMPFIGHDLFMLSLSYALKQASSSSRRRAIALVADPGAGKTRIARQFAKMATVSGFKVAWVTCQWRSTPRTTWALVFTQLLGIDPLHDFINAVMTLDSTLHELDLHDYDAALTETIIDTLVDETRGLRGLTTTSEHLRYSVTESVIALLHKLTDKTPTLIVIDNLRAENSQALETLKQVIERITNSKLVITVLHEPTENYDLDVQRMVLPDLNEDETYQVAMAILHVTDLGERLKTLLWRRTSGRPMYIESLLRLLIQQEHIDITDAFAELKPNADLDVLPDDIRELVISRVDSFHPDVQTALRAGAVLSENFGVEALVELCKLDREVLLGIITELVEAQILEDEDGDGHFCFRHGLTQRVIYESLSRAQRLQLHRAAVTFWRGYTQVEYQPKMLAYHLFKCGLLPQSVEVLTTAAEQAENSGDHERAIDLYTVSLSILPDDHHVAAQLQRLKHS